MNGNKLFLDTNIILYLLGGDHTLAELLHEKNWYISFITQLELLGYEKLNEKEQQSITELLDQCLIIDINNAIKKKVIEIKRTTGLKLPDSIIVASAIYMDLPFITADKDFVKVPGIELILYER